MTVARNGVPQTLKVVRVDDPTKLPLSYTDANGVQVVGADFSSGATGVAILRSTSSGSGYTSSASTSGTSYVEATGSNGTTYYYVVTASGAGCGGTIDGLGAASCGLWRVTSAASAAFEMKIPPQRSHSSTSHATTRPPHPRGQRRRVGSGSGSRPSSAPH